MSTALSLGAGGMKEAFVAMRLGCSVCFGVQLAFRSVYSIMYFFGYTQDTWRGLLGLVLGVIIILILLMDGIMMQAQASKLAD